jgi:hypothetical protein
MGGKTWWISAAAVVVVLGSIAAGCAGCQKVKHVGAAILEEQAPPAHAAIARTTFVSGGDLPYDKLGLYIGINKYPKMPGNNLGGCVNDAMAMQSLFAGLGVKRYVLIADGNATRAGIRRAMDALLAEVKVAKAKVGAAEPIRVVITFSGHGRRVKRLVPVPNLGPEEDTWCASDTNFDGISDVRASELLAVHSQLTAMGAEVVMVADSCHSGSGFRALDVARQPKAPADAPALPAGPSDELFQGLGARDIKPASVQAGVEAMGRGLAWYAACRDQELAFEGRDEAGQRCGRLSLAMRKVLGDAGGKMTYRGLAMAVAAELRDRWGTAQNPEFHRAQGMDDRQFLGSGTFRPAVMVVPGSRLADGSFDLSAGTLSGSAPGASFAFYRSLDDFQRRANTIGTARVDKVTLTTSRVSPEGGAQIPATALAELRAPRLREFRLAVDGSVPKELEGRLGLLDKEMQIELVSGGTPPTPDVAVLHYFPGSREVGLYRSAALPPADAATAPAEPRTILNRPPVRYEGAQSVDAVADEVLFVARMQRLLTLENPGGPAVEIRVVQKGAAPAAGVVRVPDGGAFTLRFANKSASTELFPAVFFVTSGGDVKLLYPAKSDLSQPVVPGGTFEIGDTAPFTASYDAKTARDGLDLTRMFVIATDQFVDYAPLLVPPTTRSANVRDISRDAKRGQDSVFFEVVRDILHGGKLGRELARGDVGRSVPQAWSTRKVDFYVVPR